MSTKYLSRVARALALSAAVLFCCGTTHCRMLEGSETSDDGLRNGLIGLLGVQAAGCARYADTAVPNALYSGGVRARFETSTCDDAGWSMLGFRSNGSGSFVSTQSQVITDAPFSGFGTSVEVSFTVTAETGTLDVMAYGAASGGALFSASSPTLRMVVGAACALQFRKNSDGLFANVSTCTDTQALVAGGVYTYCLDFNRGTGSGGSYTGFANMLGAWSKPCADVPQSERDQMGDLKLMQMMNIPAMNPATSGSLGFSYSGVRIRSFRVGNTNYSSAM